MSDDPKMCPVLAAGFLAWSPDDGPMTAAHAASLAEDVTCRREKCAWWVDFGKKPHCAVAMHPDTEETPDGRS